MVRPIFHVQNRASTAAGEGCLSVLGDLLALFGVLPPEILEENCAGDEEGGQVTDRLGGHQSGQAEQVG